MFRLLSGPSVGCGLVERKASARLVIVHEVAGENEYRLIPKAQFPVIPDAVRHFVLSEDPEKVVPIVANRAVCDNDLRLPSWRNQVNGHCGVQERKLLDPRRTSHLPCRGLDLPQRLYLRCATPTARRNLDSVVANFPIDRSTSTATRAGFSTAGGGKP